MSSAGSANSASGVLIAILTVEIIRTEFKKASAHQGATRVNSSKLQMVE